MGNMLASATRSITVAVGLVVAALPACKREEALPKVEPLSENVATLPADPERSKRLDALLKESSKLLETLNQDSVNKLISATDDIIAVGIKASNALDDKDSKAASESIKEFEQKLAKLVEVFAGKDEDVQKKYFSELQARTEQFDDKLSKIEQKIKALIEARDENPEQTKKTLIEFRNAKAELDVLAEIDTKLQEAIRQEK